MAAGVGAWRIPHRAYHGKMVLPSDISDYQRQRVRWATIAFQNEFIIQNFLARPAEPLTGGWGTKTDQAARAFQAAHGLVIDGLVGSRTAGFIFEPVFAKYERIHGIPDKLIMGMCRLESAFDPGAEGTVDDADRGIAQFNRRYWEAQISDETAFSNPRACIDLASKNLRTAYNKLGRWDCAVASHNNPSKAKIWAETGEAPDEQIKKYVELVYNAAAAAL